MQYTVEYIKEKYNVNPGAMRFIGFWKAFQANGFMCQWYMSNFSDEKNTYSCAEQYMMYKKAELFNDPDTAELILRETNPHAIKALGREIKNFDQTVWDNAKRGIVFMGNYLKFSQNLQLAGKLLTTGNCVLVEASPVDAVWGIAMDAKDQAWRNPNKWPKHAQNLLGFTLMEVRDAINAKFSR